MSYKDMSRGGPLEVRTRGPPFGKMPRAEQGMKRSDSIGMIEKYWDDEEEWRGYHPNACDEENKFVERGGGETVDGVFRLRRDAGADRAGAG